MNIPGRMPAVQCFHNTKEKRYPNGMSRITMCSRAIFLEPGMEPFDKPLSVPNESKPKNMQNEVRTDNLKRAKERVFDISLLNDFDYFITWTLDKQKIDRYNPQEVSKKLKVFLHNMQSRYSLKYLIVPEKHKDGALHIHGLISGNMEFFDSGTRSIPGHKKPLGIKKMRQLGYNENMDGVHIIYNMPQWSLGYSTAIRTYGASQNTAGYMTKYVTKDFQKIFGNFYYAGGDIVREPPTELYDTEYYDVNEKEYFVEAAGLGFKYITTSL